MQLSLRLLGASADLHNLEQEFETDITGAHSDIDRDDLE
jgi:hypothetical protein